MRKFIPILVLILVLGGIIVFLMPAMMHVNRRPPAIVCRIEMKRLQGGLMMYFDTYATMPTGRNADIIRILTNDNPQHIQFWWPGNRKHLNEKGEFTDPWGTPYRIEFLTNSARIWSAGEDKLFGNADDLTSDQKN